VSDKKRYRSAITGRFVKVSQGIKHSATTVAETIKLKSKPVEPEVKDEPDGG
jgi:hypothetical protein